MGRFMEEGEVNMGKGKQYRSIPIPDDIVYCKDGNALSGKRIIARYNSSLGPFLVPHKTAGGRGQAIILKKATVWIDEPFVK